MTAETQLLGTHIREVSHVRYDQQFVVSVSSGLGRSLQMFDRFQRRMVCETSLDDSDATAVTLGYRACAVGSNGGVRIWLKTSAPIKEVPFHGFRSTRVNSIQFGGKESATLIVGTNTGGISLAYFSVARSDFTVALELQLHAPVLGVEIVYSPATTVYAVALDGQLHHWVVSPIEEDGTCKSLSTGVRATFASNFLPLMLYQELIRPS